MMVSIQNIFMVLIIVLVNEVQALEDGNIEIIETNIVKINRLDGSVSGTVFGPKGRFTKSRALVGWRAWYQFENHKKFQMNRNQVQLKSQDESQFLKNRIQIEDDHLSAILCQVHHIPNFKSQILLIFQRLHLQDRLRKHRQHPYRPRLNLVCRQIFMGQQNLPNLQDQIQLHHRIP